LSVGARVADADRVGIPEPDPNGSASQPPPPPPGSPDAQNTQPPSMVPTPPGPPAPPTPPPPAPAIVTVSPVRPTTPDAPSGGILLYEPHDVAPSTWEVGGFMQPQYRLRDNSAAGNDTDGFRMVIARLSALARTKVEGVSVSGYIELDLTPQVSLFDAYVTAAHSLPHDGFLTVDVGQEKAPFSRQDLLRDSDLAFVEKAQIASLAPDRQLGMRANLSVPYAPWLRLIGGVFNGEGRNQGQNIDEKLMYVARVELALWGRSVAFAESGFNGDYLTIAADIAKNTVTGTSGNEHQLYLGYDISGAWHGLSGGFEYLQVNHSFDASADEINYHANGFVAQVNYLLPIWRHAKRALEVGWRVEEIDRNDTVPIVMIGDPNQSTREYTGVVSCYLRGHSLKVQVAYSRFKQIENLTVSGAPATFPENELLAQLTYRLE
jgi:hypothetical protein